MAIIEPKIALGESISIVAQLIDTYSEVFDHTQSVSLAPASDVALTLPPLSQSPTDVYRYSTVVFKENIYASLSPASNPSSSVISINVYNNGLKQPQSNLQNPIVFQLGVSSSNTEYTKLFNSKSKSEIISKN